MNSIDTCVQEETGRDERVQPLHQGNLDLQRRLLQKKILEGGNFSSPTDNLMSPCTTKLKNQKKKHLGKAKPMSLTNAFTQVMEELPKSSTS